MEESDFCSHGQVVSLWGVHDRDKVVTIHKAVRNATYRIRDKSQVDVSHVSNFK